METASTLQITTAARTAGIRMEPVSLGSPALDSGVDPWVTQTFQVPDVFASECLNDGLRGSGAGLSGTAPHPSALSSFPVLPSADAPPAVWRAVLTRSTAMVSRWLRKLGLEAPAGAVFVYDENSATLVVRTLSSQMALLEQVFSAYRRKVPHMLVFELEVFETDAATVRWTLAETQDRKDHTAACEHLRDLTKAGIAQSMHQIRLETRPGQRAVSEAGSDEGGAGGIVTMTESSRGGARLMVEAEADPGEADIALKLDLRLQCGPEGRMGAGAPAGTDRDVRLVTSTAMGAGTTRMIAVWTSPRSLSRQMQTAFLRAEMVPSLPLENTRLAALVERFTEPLATVVATAGTRNEPALETRVIRMKPEFFPMRIGFTSEAVLETLSYHGIAFPEGARVDYVNSVSLLVAKNAPGNLDAIQRFTEGMSSHLNKVVNVTLEIVEGDAHTMRGMVEKSRGVADHRALWSEVESLVELERVKLLRTARLEVRHGEKGWFAVGEECAEPERARGDMLSGRRARTTVHAVRLGSGNGVAKSSSGDGNKGGRNGSHAWILTAPSRLIGTWLEVAPVVNGPNMDVELEFEHHYAAPTGQAVKQGGTKNGNGNGNGNERDVEMTNYSRFRSSSSITARSGMIRLVGVWAAGDMSRTPGPATMQAAFLRVDMAWMKSGERS